MTQFALSQPKINIELKKYFIKRNPNSKKKRKRDPNFLQKDCQPSKQFKLNPEYVLELLKYKPTLLKAFNYICYLIATKPVAYPSYDHIGEITGLEGKHRRNSIADSLDILRDLGWIETNYRHDDTCVFRISSYFLIPKVRERLSKFLSALKLQLLWTKIKKPFKKQAKFSAPHKYLTPPLVNNQLSSSSLLSSKEVDINNKVGISDKAYTVYSPQEKENFIKQQKNEENLVIRNWLFGIKPQKTSKEIEYEKMLEEREKNIAYLKQQMIAKGMDVSKINIKPVENPFKREIKLTEAQEKELIEAIDQIAPGLLDEKHPKEMSAKEAFNKYGIINLQYDKRFKQKEEAALSMGNILFKMRND
jgi:hypothetical protein